MRKLYILLGIVLLTISVNGQKTILQQDVEKDQEPKKWGMNQKNYFHFFIGEGFYADQVEGGREINALKSREFEFGVRYKKAWNRHLSSGIELSYRSRKFVVSSTGIQTYNPVYFAEVQPEKLRFHDLDLVVFDRVILGKVGNAIGNFIDIGVYGNTPLEVVHTFEYTGSNGQEVRTETRKLTYTNAYNYGVLARVGFGRYVLWGRYRLSDQFEENFSFGELARISAGIQIGFHK